MTAIRWNEAALCQFDDGVCNAASVDGTGYCRPHLDFERLRASAAMDAEQPDAVEFCATDIESGQADGAAA